MVKSITCGRSFVESQAQKHGAVRGRDFEAVPVPGCDDTYALRSVTLLGQLFLSLLLVGAP